MIKDAILLTLWFTTCIIVGMALGYILFKIFKR